MPKGHSFKDADSKKQNKNPETLCTHQKAASATQRGGMSSFTGNTSRVCRRLTDALGGQSHCNPAFHQEDSELKGCDAQ